MHTYVEFFSENVLENICSTLIEPPERLVLIGDLDDGEILERHRERYLQLFRKKRIQTAVSIVLADRNDMLEIAQTLDGIIREVNETFKRPGECAIDLTGGDDLCLAAAGIVYGRYESGSNAKKPQLHRVDICTGGIYDCDGDGIPLENKYPASLPDGQIPSKLSFRDLAELYGFNVSDGGNTVGEIAKDHTVLDRLWQICYSDSTEWNRRVSDFGREYVIEEERLGKTASGVSMSVYHIKHVTSGKPLSEAARKKLQNWLNRIIQAGAIEQRDAGDLVIKSPLVKECLVKSGTVLELKTLYRLSLLKESDEEGARNLFHDKRRSFVLDYDLGTGYSPENEIDVIMMRGMTPYLISCKNGSFGSDELFKLYSLGDKIGGRYAKKILLYGQKDLRTSSPRSFEALQSRAAALGIRLVSASCLNWETLDLREAVLNW